MSSMIDTSGLKEVRKKLFSMAVERQTQKLLEYAPLMLKKAFNTKTFTRRTWNLADSYLWIVYYKGEIKGSGFLWNSRFASKDSIYHDQKVNGRKIAQNFINSFVPSDINGWQIIWAATAPYSTDLEKSNKFYVISGIYDDVLSDFKGKAKVDFEINV